MTTPSSNLSRRAVLRGGVAVGAVAYTAPLVAVVGMSPASAQVPSPIGGNPGGPGTGPQPPTGGNPGGPGTGPQPPTGGNPGGPGTGPETPISGNPGGPGTGPGTPTRAVSGSGGGAAALPFTGAETAVLAAAAGAAIVTGAGLAAAGRRRDEPAVDGPAPDDQEGAGSVD